MKALTTSVVLVPSTGRGAWRRTSAARSTSLKSDAGRPLAVGLLRALRRQNRRRPRPPGWSGLARASGARHVRTICFASVVVDDQGPRPAPARCRLATGPPACGPRTGVQGPEGQRQGPTGAGRPLEKLGFSVVAATSVRPSGFRTLGSRASRWERARSGGPHRRTDGLSSPPATSLRRALATTRIVCPSRPRHGGRTDEPPRRLLPRATR